MKYYIVHLQDSQTEYEYRIVRADSKELVSLYFRHIRYVTIIACVDKIITI